MLLKKHHDIFGIRTYRVFLLYLIVKLTGAKIVLTSTWRKSLDSWTNKKVRSLRSNFGRFGLSILDVTPTVSTSKYGSHRQEEIKAWLKATPLTIKSFVIIDDEKADLEDMEDKLVYTRNKKTRKILGRDCANTGLKLRHVFKAIKILHKED